jgi:hypothetical protein
VQGSERRNERGAIDRSLASAEVLRRPLEDRAKVLLGGVRKTNAPAWRNQSLVFGRSTAAYLVGHPVEVRFK